MYMGNKGSEICINKPLDMRLNSPAVDPAKEMQKGMITAKKKK